MDPDLAHAPQLLRHHESIRWRDSHVGQESTARTMFIWVVATLGMQAKTTSACDATSAGDFAIRACLSASVFVASGLISKTDMFFS
jgi:hypothetical protein